MQDKQPKALDRRNFLRAVGGASTLTVAAAVVPTEADAYDPGAAETKGRYRETDHVKTFYRVNRYPAKR